MGKSKAISIDNGTTGLRIEHVKSRGALRVLVTDNEGPATPPLELPVSEFFESLGIERDDMAPFARYLLFAGCHQYPLGGLRDLVSGFGCEQEARARFQELRLSREPQYEWAELAAVDGHGQLSRVSWFGRPWELARSGKGLVVVPGGSRARRPRWFARRR